MTIHEAAYKLLQEEQRPMKPEELAERALERGLVTSNAKNRVFSLQTTLRKNIRDGEYNRPQLITISQPGQRGMLVSLPEWQTTTPKRQVSVSATEYVERKIQLPGDIAKQIDLVRAAGIVKTFDDALIHLLRRGWSGVRSEVQTELDKLLKDGSRSE